MQTKVSTQHVEELEAPLVLKKTEDAFTPVDRLLKFKRTMQSISSRSVALNLVMSYCLAASVTANLYLGWAAVNREREYFAADNGRFVPLVPMSKPYRKNSEVIQYARDTINQSFALDFLNYRAQLENVRGRYTKNGFKSFLDSLNASGLLNQVKEKRMAISITAGTGVLSQEGIENGTYTWIIEMPIEVKLAGQTSELVQRYKAKIRVERTTTLDSVEGIAIGQLITVPL